MPIVMVDNLPPPSGVSRGELRCSGEVIGEV